MGMLMTIRNSINDSKENSPLLNILKHSWEQYGNHGIQQEFREHIHSLMDKTFCSPLRHKIVREIQNKCDHILPLEISIMTTNHNSKPLSNYKKQRDRHTEKKGQPPQPLGTVLDMRGRVM